MILKKSHKHLYFANISKKFKVNSFLCCNGAVVDMLLPSVANGIAAETRMLLLEINELPLFVPVLFILTMKQWENGF